MSARTFGAAVAKQLAEDMETMAGPAFTWSMLPRMASKLATTSAFLHGLDGPVSGAAAHAEAARILKARDE